MATRQCGHPTRNGSRCRRRIAHGHDCPAKHPEAASLSTTDAASVAAHDPFATPTNDPTGDPAIRDALTFAADYCHAAGGARPGTCHPASWNIRDRFGYTMVQGQRGGIPHTWNVLPDGRILDATAAQFGDPGPGLYPANDPRYTR
ncbi:hypothetical protein DVS28_b0302 (plasmid) [Euzebya pacifica]|uniref:Uncharacterized protein n=1 Tax=Euzebya pacifica TaxID=1608957 RepID=A0A346Y6H5_9ACTN|nr:hypothetical protein [Euzebya pacifica]AXV10072.1 hypothetical protein DVS28_b0302 [Euzebya pacifica]